MRPTVCHTPRCGSDCAAPRGIALAESLSTSIPITRRGDSPRSVCGGRTGGARGSRKLPGRGRGHLRVRLRVRATAHRRNAVGEEMLRPAPNGWRPDRPLSALRPNPCEPVKPVTESRQAGHPPKRTNAWVVLRVAVVGLDQRSAPFLNDQPPTVRTATGQPCRAMTITIPSGNLHPRTRRPATYRLRPG